MDEKINALINKLKTKKITHWDIPIEYLSNEEIISAERKLGIRIPGNRGYDVIKDKLFVEEITDENRFLETITFDKFDDYYKFLNGNIYEEACYYQYNFKKEIIKKYNINMSRINSQSLIDYKIDKDYYKKYIEEKNTVIIDDGIGKWFNKVFKTKNFLEFNDVINRYRKSKNYHSKLEKILITRYMQLYPKKVYPIYLEAIEYFSDKINEKSFALFYSPRKVLEEVNYNKNIMSKTSIERYKKKLKLFVENYEKGIYKKEVNCYFDKTINYYVFEEKYYDNPVICRAWLTRYYENINELKEFLKYDLSNCNLADSNITANDVKDCIINESTILPFIDNEIKYEIKKYFYNDSFYVEETWINNNNIVCNKKETFKYFFDFVYYLNGDLSNADLLFCEGLMNLKPDIKIDFSNAHITSKNMEKLNIKYSKILVKNDNYELDYTKENENKYLNAIDEERELINTNDFNYRKYRYISYISDIHLMHKLEKCKSQYDIEYEIKKIVNVIMSQSSIILIGGDVSSDFNYYKIFIEELAKQIKDKDYYKIIFILGNHELWNFKNIKVDEIINKYRELIVEHNMYFINNGLLYIENRTIKEITEQEIINSSYEEIQNRLINSELVIIGGIGFSGFNDQFNANNGIYRFTINRKEEIKETNRFLNIYNKLKECISDRNVVVFTHMPKIDWSGNNDFVKNWVYVSGHTHRNYYFDDGECRFYADNQIGYYNRNFSMKSFYIEYTYDVFAYYKDGIYKITKEQYIEFNRGKNINMEYNRDGDIYMLKKNGYYCFIKPSIKGLAILNGGALKSLNKNDINYYFNNMDSQIQNMIRPYQEYYNYQKSIAKIIKDIGGDGYIHGSIIDIDFYNHIYVNPYDRTIHGYYAIDIIDKYVYPSIQLLLKERCPELYDSYIKRIGEEKNNTLTVLEKNNSISQKPIYFDSTYIYKASNIIKKMQKINNGILTIWKDSFKNLLND